MSRYYDFDGNGFTKVPSDTVRTRMARDVLSNHDVEDFLCRCEKDLGVVVKRQARAILVERAYCEEQNSNALQMIRAFAIEREEWELALSLGDYFDRMSY